MSGHWLIKLNTFFARRKIQSKQPRNANAKKNKAKYNGTLIAQIIMIEYD